jgi:hypothetical protein
LPLNVKTKNESPKKLQLWTNADKSEYAIYLNHDYQNINNLVIATNNHNINAEYTELHDKSDYHN